MAQRDYLLKMIEQALEALLQAAKHRQEGRHQQSVHSVIDSMEKLFGLTIADLGSKSVDQLFHQLTAGEPAGQARDKCLVFAALNYQAGLAYADKGLPALAQPAFYLALEFTVRALARFPRTDLPSFTPDVGELVRRLEGFALPADLQSLIADQTR